MSQIDAVYASFLATAAEDAAACVVASDTLLLRARPGSGEPPAVYDGWLTDVEHLVRKADGTVSTSLEPVPFRLTFPPDYCRSTDPGLTFRVAKVLGPLFHPNANAGGILCLGADFRPGTCMRPLVEQIHAIVSGTVAATAGPLDLDASRYYLAHPEQLRGLRSRPLWRRPVAARARVERLVPAGGGS